MFPLCSACTIIGWCSSFVATQKHAERGLAYNCASFSRVAASTMLSATLLHLYYFVSISQRSFVTEEPSPRLDFLMVRPLADRGKAYTVHLIGSARRSRSGLSVFSCLGGWFVKDKTCILILSQCRIWCSWFCRFLPYGARFRVWCPFVAPSLL